jgi:hypothetical protein
MLFARCMHTPGCNAFCVCLLFVAMACCVARSAHELSYWVVLQPGDAREVLGFCDQHWTAGRLARWQ